MTFTLYLALSYSMKASLRFLWFCVFFVSKGNPFWLFFYTEIVGFPVGSNCAPLVADFLFCFVMKETLWYLFQVDIVEAYNRFSRHLDDLLNIDDPYLEGMFIHIYPAELQLNKTNCTDTGPILDLHLFNLKRFCFVQTRWFWFWHC